MLRQLGESQRVENLIWEGGNEGGLGKKFDCSLLNHILVSPILLVGSFPSLLGSQGDPCARVPQ